MKITNSLLQIVWVRLCGQMNPNQGRLNIAAKQVPNTFSDFERFCILELEVRGFDLLHSGLPLGSLSQLQNLLWRHWAGQGR